MDIFNILTEIISKPDAKRYFLELQKYYEKQNLIHESDVVKHIINTVIENDDKKSNDCINK